MAEAMAEGKAEAESAGVARVVVAPSAASDIARFSVVVCSPDGDGLLGVTA